MAMIVGLLLGGSGMRFWWQGLSALIALAIVLPFISTLVLMNDPTEPNYGYDFSPMSVARVSAIQLVHLLFWYCVGAGVHWLFERFKKKPEETE